MEIDACDVRKHIAIFSWGVIGIAAILGLSSEVPTLLVGGLWTFGVTLQIGVGTLSVFMRRSHD